MNRLLFEPVKEWLGFTRCERRASFILLIFILSVTGLKYIIPERHISIEEVPLEVRDTVNIYLSGMRTSEAGTTSRGIRDGRQRSLLDINRCDSASLEALPGIGPVLSARIIKYRSLLGGFAHVDQLREVYGLPEETFEMISGRLYADSSAVQKININSTDYRQLIRFPYFERFEVTAILKYRELHGRVDGFNELLENKLIAPEKAGKIRPYLEY
ncbi:MAG: helix-hairpin-helix domain-containing protein [Bacteroidota bacterium]